MDYHGRIVGAGLTSKGEPTAFYGISVRSLDNQKRHFVPFDDRLYVDAAGKRTKEQQKNAHLIFYNTMKRRGDVLIATNGAHTDSKEKDGKQVPNFYENFSEREPIDSSEAIMQAWGFEPDSMSTPRVAVVRTPEISVFSIATNYRNSAGVGAVKVAPSNGDATALGTYCVADGKAVSWSIPGSGHLDKCLFRIHFDGLTEEEIAEELYEFMHPDIRVAAAAAVYRGEKWNVFPLNRFNTEEEFQAYRAEREAKK